MSIRSEIKLPVGSMTLRKNFSWTLAGNIVYAGCQWGMLVVIAKLGTPEMVGKFGLGLAVTAPVIVLANLQLRAVQATDAKGEYRFAHYLGLRLLTSSLALLVIAGIAFVSGYTWEKSLLIMLVGIAKAFESISDIFYGLLQQHERMDRIAQSMMIKGPLSLIALGMGVYLTGSILWGVAGFAVTWALVMIGYDISSGIMILRLDAQRDDRVLKSGSRWDALRPQWERETLTKLIRLVLPLGFVTMLLSLNTNIPRYFIEHYGGEYGLGIFTSIAYLMVAGNTVVNALGQSASPRLARLYAAGQIGAYRVLLLKLLGVGAAIGGCGILVAMVAGRNLLTLFYKPEYAKQSDVFIGLMYVAGISYISSCLGYGITAARYFKVQMPLYGIMTCTTAICSFLLIPSYGMQGAVMSLMIAAIVGVIGCTAVVIYACLNHKGRPDREHNDD